MANLCIVRFAMTTFQIIKKGNLLDKGEYYKYLYFEFPYHLFNVAAFIVLMQWYVHCSPHSFHTYIFNILLLLSNFKH